jgi:hypothetical protein
VLYDIYSRYPREKGHSQLASSTLDSYSIPQPASLLMISSQLCFLRPFPPRRMITGNDTGGEFSGIRGVGTEPQGLIRRGVCRRQTAAPPRNVRWGLFLPACAPGGSTRTGSSSAPLWRRRDTWLNRAPTQARKDKRLHAGRQVCTHASTYAQTHVRRQASTLTYVRTHIHTHTHIHTQLV